MEKKILLNERDLPTQWYNIVADMPNKPLPPLHPATKQPVGPDDLAPIFPMALIEQEVSAERYIDIPEEVQQAYRIWRPTPLIRATNLEKALGTDCKIYYKYEGTSPSGSHKPNTAIPQAYYNKQAGVKRIITETGAGQWGTALSFACSQFGIDCEVYMVRISFDQKPYRKILMNTFGATVHSSPTNHTQAGRNALAANPDTPGSLGLAISEAIEMAVGDEHTKYALGSVLNHVLLHQTIIGQEAKKQMEYTGDYPDIIIAPLGGGSNFAGLSFPFIQDKIAGKPLRCVAVEPASCPKLTKGKFMYDFGDTQGYTPLLPMYTLGHTFTPAAIHAGGLRYHGASVLCSQLLKDGLIEAQAIQQLECFEAGILFAKAEGIVPAPEANHGIAQVIREVNKAKEEGVSKTILFNLCGHGFVDMAAYQDYFDGKLRDHSFTDEELTAELVNLEALQP
ncbi:TrpB-like pyridoxal phosphate-dependent enzyme [Parapedobacter sp. 10938]|uniref:TrpB-like pyridoxal phosphate-dependent enzyme n=1 Tax=Parapedobacter flavus TaxID=3110225 RepID=UPI002DB655D0|nr:TrpB-like pyridoxal phosphate-dependent enzyme [Parapedobacter sp. 10938]MEC3881108.1 TrpB-like pyridoxal phosphate-dependent enzyme [Parapedobacter sp. 10938]